MGRLRAVARNAIVWGAAWAAAAFVVALALLVSRGEPVGVSVLNAIGMAVRFSVVGVIVGAAFGAIVRFAYRGRRLGEISALKFGLAGAVLAPLIVLLFMETASILTGGGVVPWRHVNDDVVITALFGGLVAGGTLFLAQRAARHAPDDESDLTPEPLDGAADDPLLGAGDVAPTGAARSRSAARR